MSLGRPRLHLRETTSTNDRARELAAAGAPHGTLVTAGAQSAGRGRQGRTWSAPPGRALLARSCSARTTRCCRCAPGSPWPTSPGRPRASSGPTTCCSTGASSPASWSRRGPQDGWAVLGIGVNVAVAPQRSPARAARPGGDAGPSARRARGDARRAAGAAGGAPGRAAGRVPRRAARRATRCATGPSAGPAARAPAPASTTPARCSSGCRTGRVRTLESGEVHLGGLEQGGSCRALDLEHAALRVEAAGAEKPRRLPSAASTRWQGTTIGNGLRPSAWPTACADAGSPTSAATSP